MNKISILMLITVIVGALVVVTVRHENRLVFVDLQKTENQRTHLQAEWSRLMLEKATWAMENNIADDAGNRLGMLPPPASQMITLQLKSWQSNQSSNGNRGNGG